jgi:large subunit ribosomal protein L17
MRHLKVGRKLGRNSSHRKVMFKNMITSLLEHGQIRTTLAKAKELRRYVEPLITLAGKNAPSSLEGLRGDELRTAQLKRAHAVRQARKVVENRDVLKLLFGEYAERYQNRPGGYTRVFKAGFRPGDNAPMAVIALVAESYDPSQAIEVEEPAEAPAVEEAVEASDEGAEALED